MLLAVAVLVAGVLPLRQNSFPQEDVNHATSPSTFFSLLGSLVVYGLRRHGCGSIWTCWEW